MRTIPIIVSQTIAGALVALACLFSPLAAMAQEATSPASDYVSRAEYDKLKAEHEAMKQELESLKTAVQQMANGTVPAAPAEGPARATSGEGKQVVAAQNDTAQLHEQVDALEKEVHKTIPGTTKLLIAGYGTAGFTARSGEDPSFDASFNALLLYKLSDRLFFEGEMELEFENNDTTINLEVAQASYLLNDYMTIGVGRFLNPMNFFVERQHMNWVNKLPDKPLAVYDGLFPESDLGAQLRGVIPIGSTKLEYVGFVANAPDLITSSDDPAEVGMLSFPNTANFGGHVAVGGHIGFIPIPQLEIGYGIQRSKVGPRDTAAENILQSVDFNYVRDSTLLKGLINFRAQWGWSHVGHLVYDPNGAEGFGPLDFNNNRNGGYVQLAYRPTHVDNDFIKNFEPVLRYDRLNQLHTPVGFDEQRWTLGLNYWVTPSAVFKAAYELDNKNAGAPDQDAFMLQMAVGF